MVGFMKKMFRGMETPAEEKKEAKALKAGKITPKQYVAGEKAEGHGAGAAKKAVAIKSGKLSPAKYAAEHKEKAMACGGKVKKMAMGGATAAAVQSAADKIKAAPQLMAQKAAALKAAAPAPIKTAPAAPTMADKIGAKVRSQTSPGMIRAAQVKAAMPARPMAKGGGVEAKGKTAGKTVKMAKGGSARGCGIAVKGKTKGKMV